MIKSRFFFVVIALILVASACANTDSNKVVTAPTDQLIEGGFDITTEWQTIAFEKPLETAPYLQDLNFNFNPDQYDFADIDGKADPLDTVGYETIIRKKDNQLLFPKVIFIDQDGNELRAGINSFSGYTYSEDNHRLAIGFGISSKHQEVFFSPDVKIKAIKVKANVPMYVESMHWLIGDYSLSPGDKWDSIKEKDILKKW